MSPDMNALYEGLARAKQLFTEAAKAALTGDPAAPERAKAAYQDVERARTALNNATARSGA
jgi:hypothetical protein